MSTITLTEKDVELKAIRSSGPGGQNVNKVATAIQLQFDSQASGLSDELKVRILELKDQRISSQGIITITARQHRTQEANRQAALNRLNAIIEKAAFQPAKRKRTKPTKASVARRLEEKTKRSRLKQQRGQIKPPTDD